MYFVAGITGHVGGATARNLLDSGQKVRALVRDPNRATEWSDKGVDIRKGDLNDPASIADALDGVRGAYLMIPPAVVPSPGFTEAKAVIASFQAALAQAPPPRLILLSSFGSERASGLGNIMTTHLMEEALSDLPFPTAFVRAGSFLENYSYALDMAAATGVFAGFHTPTDRPVPMVATADIGAEVARLLVGNWTGKKIIELGTATSPDQLAEAISAVLGSPVQASAIPREEWPATLEQMGFPPGQTALYEEMMDGINSGWIAFGNPGTEHVPATVQPVHFFMQANGVRINQQMNDRLP